MPVSAASPHARSAVAAQAPAGPGQRVWYLGWVDVFGGLSAEDAAALGPLVRRESFRAGQLIAGPDTPPERVYVVESGTVRLVRRGADGRETTVDVVGRGRLFGVSARAGRKGRAGPGGPPPPAT
jgi:CRP-like cAMP-binding protein